MFWRRPILIIIILLISTILFLIKNWSSISNEENNNKNNNKTVKRVQLPDGNDVVVDNDAQDDNNNININNKANHNPKKYQSSTRLPQWIKDYFDWHIKERRRLQHHIIQNNNNNDFQDVEQSLSSFRFLIMRCYKRDNCGGTGDRLKSLPLVLLLAAESKRLLFIKWQEGTPFELEEFLLPNEIDWTIPRQITTAIISNDRIGKTATSLKVLERRIHTNRTNIGSKLQIPSSYYNDEKWKTSSLTQSLSIQQSQLLFHDIFHALFQPSAPIAALMQQEMLASNLHPGKYIAVHLRAKFPGEPYRIAQQQQDIDNNQREQILLEQVTKALHCASHLKPKVPIYFAADATQAIDMVRHPDFLKTITTTTTTTTTTSSSSSTTRRMRNITTIRSQRASSVHLAFANLDDPSGYYPIFVDLLLMGNADCVSYGKGGFGQLASYISYNATCYQYRRPGDTYCDTWQD